MADNQPERKKNLVIEKIIEQLDSILNSPLHSSDLEGLRQTILDVILFEKNISVLKNSLLDCCNIIQAINKNFEAIQATQVINYKIS